MAETYVETETDQWFPEVGVGEWQVTAYEVQGFLLG